MNRPFAIAMGAAALLLAAAVAMADDAPATSSSAPPATSAPAATKAPATTAHHSSSKSSSTHHHSMVNLNTASKDQLAKLPGMTEDTADKIIAARPFKSTNELVSKKIIDEAEYKKLQSHVTAKHS